MFENPAVDTKEQYITKWHEPCSTSHNVFTISVLTCQHTMVSIYKPVQQHPVSTERFNNKDFCTKQPCEEQDVAL